MTSARAIRTALVAVFLCLSFVVAALPLLQPVKARVVGADWVSDQVADGIDTLPVGIELTWAAPTAYTDGSAIPPDQTIVYDIEHAAPLTETVVFRVGATTTYTFSNVFRGAHVFRVRAVVARVAGDWTEAITVDVI